VQPTPARHLEALASLGVATVFLLSAWFVPGRAVSPLYVVAILLAMWSDRPRLGYVLAALSTAGIMTSGLIHPEPNAGAQAFTAAVAIAACWSTAYVVDRYRRSGAALVAAERALGQSAKDLQHVRHALDQSAIVAMTDVKGTITFVNDKFCEISKYDREELIGANHRMLNSGLHSLDFFREMYRTIGAGRVWRAELRNRAKDGSLYWVDTTIVPFLDDRGRPQQYIAIRYDITERKKSEAALRAQTALVQLGKMAAIVAHEVRNPLAGIRGAMQVLGRRMAPGTPEHGVVNEVVTRIDTLNDIVQDLLLFARPRQPAIVAVSAATLLANTVGLLKDDPKFAGVSIAVEETNADLKVDPEQLKLVLMNLLINSAQAMGGQGQIKVQVLETADARELRIIDHGPGIPAGARDHLFEPFFTTKHRGTGLGLATAKRIMEGHGGTLDLVCPPGGGTIATLRLPA
jgi:PAS domain S-box-containing protein